MTDKKQDKLFKIYLDKQLIIDSTLTEEEIQIWIYENTERHLKDLKEFDEMTKEPDKQEQICLEALGLKEPDILKLKKEDI